MTCGSRECLFTASSSHKKSKKTHGTEELADVLYLPESLLHEKLAFVLYLYVNFCIKFFRLMYSTGQTSPSPPGINWPQPYDKPTKWIKPAPPKKKSWWMSTIRWHCSDEWTDPILRFGGISQQVGENRQGKNNNILPATGTLSPSKKALAYVQSKNTIHEYFKHNPCYKESKQKSDKLA